MAKLRSVNTHFWTDGFVADLNPAEKLLFLYLLTNPLTNLAGCYELPMRQIVFDTGFDRELIREMLAMFESKKKIYYRDGWVFLANFFKNQKLNTNQLKNAESELEKSPDWVKAIISTNPKSFGTLSKAFKGFDIKEKRIEEEFKSPLPPKGDGTAADALGASGEEKDLSPRPPKSRTPATDAAATLDTWLAEIAKAVGADSPGTMADYRKWERVAMSAITEKIPLEKALKTIRRELERTRGQPQYFSPDTVLKILQSEKASPATANGFYH